MQSRVQSANARMAKNRLFLRASDDRYRNDAGLAERPGFARAVPSYPRGTLEETRVRLAPSRAYPTGRRGLNLILRAAASALSCSSTRRSRAIAT